VINFAWVKLVADLTPVVFSFIPGLKDAAPLAAVAIQSAEAIPSASGADKLTYATQAVLAGVAFTNNQAGRQVIDPAVVAAVAPAAITSIVGAANAIHDSHAPAAGA